MVISLTTGVPRHSETGSICLRERVWQTLDNSYSVEHALSGGPEPRQDEIWVFDRSNKVRSRLNIAKRDRKHIQSQ